MVVKDFKTKEIDLGTSFESLRKEEVRLLKDVPESIA